MPSGQAPWLTPRDPPLPQLPPDSTISACATSTWTVTAAPISTAATDPATTDLRFDRRIPWTRPRTGVPAIFTLLAVSRTGGESDREYASPADHPSEPFPDSCDRSGERARGRAQGRAQGFARGGPDGPEAGS
ncbi:hypothetical protein GCM10010468_23880 [Actinocorallia longicatena]|uniref:Uncharacterized protein n=1 Tax=Actinocorallia longicatena TaxID=111803 RepID=A0ABP6Q9H4_9ACTN